MKTTVLAFISKRTLGLYLLTWIMVIILSGFGIFNVNDCFITIFGGIKISEVTYGLDVLGIVRWNVITLIPILTSLIYLSTELGARGVFILIRYKSILQWWFERIIAIQINNYIYLLIGMLTFSIIKWGQITEVNTRNILLALLLIPLFTMAISFTVITVYIFSGSYQYAISAYVLIVGVTSGLGSVIKEISKYSFGFYGMTVRTDLFNQKYGFSPVKSAFIMLLVICINIWVNSLCLKRNKLSFVKS